MYCHHCGKEVTEGYEFCPFCGAQLKQQPVELEKVPAKKKNRDKDICYIGFIFCLINTIFCGFALIPLIWMIPLTVTVYHDVKENKPMGLGLKIVVLLFVSLLGGLFLLIGDPDND